MHLLIASADSDSANGGAALVFLLVIFALAIVVLVAAWKVFEKAGEAGWKALIPIYNYYVLLRIVGRPGWWLILYFIPIVGFITGIIVANDASKSFGKSAGFTVGLIFLPFIFVPILGYGDARYLGPAGPEGASSPPPPPPPTSMPPPPPSAS